MQGRVIVGFCGCLFAAVTVVGFAKNIVAMKIRWGTVQGSIDRFQMVPFNRSDSPPSYEIRAIYSYSVGEKIWQGTAVKLDTTAVMSAFQVSKRFGSIEPTHVTVYYDVKRPSVAVLIKPPVMLHWVMVAFSGALTSACWWFFLRLGQVRLD